MDELSRMDKLGAASGRFLRTTVVDLGADDSAARARIAGFLAAKGTGGRWRIAGFVAAKGSGNRAGLRTVGVAGTTIVSGTVGLALAVGAGACEGGAGAASTAGATVVGVGAAPVSEDDSVCAITRPLLRRPRPLTKLSPCINRGQR